jgi:hypothetical protein
MFYLFLLMLLSCSKCSLKHSYKIRELRVSEVVMFNALKSMDDLEAFKIVESWIKRDNKVKLVVEDSNGKTFLCYAREKGLEKCYTFLERQIKWQREHN